MIHSPDKTNRVLPRPGERGTVGAAIASRVRTRTSTLAWLLAIFVLLPVAGMLLLYAYRSQSPAVPTVPLSRAIDDVNAARVDTVIVEDNGVTLVLVDGAREHADTGGNPEALFTAVTEFNRRLPGHTIVVREEHSPTYGMSPVAVAFRFLPLAIVLAMVAFALWLMSRRSDPARYEQLARIAELRDRGVLSEDEFQREKRRIMR